MENEKYPSKDEQIRLAKEYYIGVDTRNPKILDMFTEDVQAYFPKIGTVKGKTQLINLIGGVNASVKQFSHQLDSFIFTQSHNRLIVEGLEAGLLVDGTPFPGTSRSEGRFCSVFEFRGNQISRMHIYVDPDFTGRHSQI